MLHSMRSVKAFSSGNRVDILVKAGEPGEYVVSSGVTNQGLGPEEIGPLFKVVVSGDPMDMALPETLNQRKRRNC